MTPLPLEFDPPLPADEERALARAVEAGVYAAHLLSGPGHAIASAAELEAVVVDGRRAAERMLSTNLRLVVHLVRVVSRRRDAEEDELFQEGFLGLHEALHRYDWRSSARFGTWARHWVLGRVRRAALAGAGHANRTAARAMHEVRRRAEVLSHADGREVGLVEAARSLGHDAHWVALHDAPRLVPLVTADGAPLDIAAPVRDEAMWERALFAQVAALGEEPRAVVTATILRGWSRRRAARELGMSERRVREVHELAVRRLRRVWVDAG